MGERGVASSVLLLIRNLTHRVDKEGKREEKYGEVFFLFTDKAIFVKLCILLLSSVSCGFLCTMSKQEHCWREAVKLCSLI